MRGTLTVNAVPDDLRHGLFAAPDVHDAVARFSPNAPLRLPRDAHGLAIKVYVRNVECDFILANSDVFFIRHAADAVQVFEAKSRGGLRGTVQLGVFFARRPKQLWNLITTVSRSVRDPLTVRYFSQTAYQLGPAAVKYGTQPYEGGFDIMIQRQQNGDPTNDPTVRWRDSWINVARFRGGERVDGETLSFNVCNALPDMMPLGEINAIRCDVYRHIHELRREYNRGR